MKLIHNTMKGSILKILLDVRNLFRAQANGVRSHRGQNKRRSVCIFFFFKFSQLLQFKLALLTSLVSVVSELVEEV